MRPELAAHTPPDHDPLRWHDLFEHVRAVAALAEQFSEPYGGGYLASLLGLVHDAAKANPAFQRYLDDCARGRAEQSVPHAAPGAAAGRQFLGPFVLAVLGHHTGLCDAGEAGGKLHEVDSGAVQAASAFLQRLQVDIGKRPGVPDWATTELGAEMFLRFCFSALVDADYLDTERHFDDEKAARRPSYAPLADYARRLDAYLAAMTGSARPTLVNNVRGEVLSACLAAASLPPGAFRLSVPTGGGKTLSGLAFALQHATRPEHRMDRVIVAIPYTSIIDQTAQVYGNVFGEDAILEHHSAVETADAGEGQTARESRRRLAAENWDCPLIATTTVQLFESLLANKPSRCRKLHNIARSVIILDEVQTLPPACLGPILDVLNELVSHYGCSVVFCTATQPDYSAVDDRMLRDAREIVQDYARHFELLKRVRYEVVEDEWSIEKVAERIDDQQQILTVLNSRRDALDIARACRRDCALLHLSTLLCGHHRKWVVAEAKLRLRYGQPVRLVSTQVVEAGVDVDFPIVMRDMGPLDRIIQVAGRCNREGNLVDQGTCIVFRLLGGRAPKGAYRTFTEVTGPIIADFGERLDHPKAAAQYFREAFRHTETDAAGIQALRKALAYRTVAQEFRLIDDNTMPVVVLDYPFADVGALVSGWKAMAPRLFFRRLAPFTVTVYERDLQQLRRDGFITDHETGALLYTGGYDPLFGIAPGLPDPADLIV